MKRKIDRWIAFSFVFAWVFALRAEAVDFSYPNDAELRLLPPFCTWKLRGGAAEYKLGFGLLGEQFKNSHHFCAGLNFLNRYYRAPTGPDAGAMLHRAENEFTYMIDHLAPNSSLGAESFMYRGMVRGLAKKDSAAAADLVRAIALDPRLAKAYLALADFYAARKQQGEALRVVSEGLRHAPASRALQRRYTELGGKLPYPEPLVVEAAPAPPPASPSAPPAVEMAPAASGDPRSAVDSPALGAKPWCRFCPDE